MILRGEQPQVRATAEDADNDEVMTTVQSQARGSVIY